MQEVGCVEITACCLQEISHDSWHTLIYEIHIWYTSTTNLAKLLVLSAKLIQGIVTYFAIHLRLLYIVLKWICLYLPSCSKWRKLNSLYSYHTYINRILLRVLNLLHLHNYYYLKKWVMQDKNSSNTITIIREITVNNWQ